MIAAPSDAAPLLEQLARAFETEQREASVLIDVQPAPRAVAEVSDGSVALAAVAGSPPEGMWHAPIAVDAIAVVVHADNPLQALTLAQLYDVFVGRTWHWSELGVALAEDEITVISRQPGSGIRAAFEAQAMAQGPDCRPIVAVELSSLSAGRAPTDERPPDADCPPCEADAVTSTAVLRMDGAAVIQYVAQHPAAIGYVAHGQLGTGAPAGAGAWVKALPIENAPPLPAHVVDGSYRLSLPLYLVAPQEPADAGPASAGRRFVDFCLDDKGQALVAQHYVPVRQR